jgi:hypothetical protein
LIYYSQYSQTKIENLYKKVQNIERFKLDFNRIMSTFRDLASGLY